MRAVLFDLDGTLLDIDLNAFLKRYFVALEAASAPLAEGYGSRRGFMDALHAATGEMMRPHPRRTNREVFYDELRARTSVDLAVHWPVYQEFYERVFPTLGDTAGPAKGARRAVTTALELGFDVAIATNPIFPRVAVDHRLSWAGLADLPLSVVTTYEDMRACKPYAAYYLQVAEMLRVDPRDCLMVGDDRALDMPAADVGMRTYYVGSDDRAVADMRGDLDALAELLPHLL